jgi:hypothetical protein
MRELYDLEKDPKEEHNIADQEGATAREMEEELEGWIAGRLKAQGESQDPLLVHGISLLEGNWDGT